MSHRETEFVKANRDLVEVLQREAVDRLTRSGMLAVLRSVGRSRRYRNGADINVMASEGSYSAGWNDCLDAILDFKDIFLRTPEEENPGLRPNFGALGLAVASKDLSEEEANAVRTGTTPDYTIDKLTNNIKPPATKPASGNKPAPRKR